MMKKALAKMMNQDGTMPQLLKNIDEIGRTKQRDVLFLEFGARRNCRANPIREQILNWLDANQIGYWECGGYTDEFSIDSYQGQIYIDVAYDTTDPLYNRLQDFLEKADGTMKWDGTRFLCYPLAYCMRNAQHDKDKGDFENDKS